MTLVRRVAHPMLASLFVLRGVDVLRNPSPYALKAQKVTPWVQRVAPQLPDDAKTLVRINGAAQLTGGLLLAAGRVPRVSASVLATSLVPTTLAQHRFWEETDTNAANNQRRHFMKNVAIFGGLLLAAVDTEGQPGLAWRTRHAGGELQSSSRRIIGRARREAKIAAREAKQEAKLRKAQLA